MVANLNATAMSPLSDDYLRSLEPETMRYDVTIFDDFVLSVLPNGLKTWAFLYEHEGRTRRKTLGVYPDMTYAQAEDALDHARSMILKLGDDIKDSPVEPDTPRVEIPPEAIAPPTPDMPPLRPAVLASRRHRRRHTSSARRWPTLRKSTLRLLVLGTAGVAVALVGVLVVPRLGLFNGISDAAPAAGETNRGREAPKPIVLETAGAAPDSRATDATTQRDEAAATDATSDAGQPDTAPPEPGLSDAETLDAAGARDDTPRSQDSSPTPTPQAAARSVGAGPDVAASETSKNALADRAAAALDPDTDTQESQSALVDTLAPDTQEPGSDAPQGVSARDDLPESQAASAAASQIDPEPTLVARNTMDPPSTDPLVADDGQTTQAPDNVASVAPPGAATSSGGRVTRAIVTSGVENIEPIDDLGEDIALDGAGFRTVFYYTELRGFTAGTVVHRWTYNGRVIADVPLKVGGNWRWRTYSSKDLLPGMTGDWRVAVVDADGRVLGERQFRYSR